MESTNFEITYPINKKYRYIISMGLFSVSLFLFSFVFLIQIIFNYMFFEFEKLTEDTSKLTMHLIYRSQALRDQMLQLPFAQGLNMAHNRLQELVLKSK